MSYAFDAMDADRDGMLSPAEQPGGRGKPLTREAHRTRLADAFRRQDANRRRRAERRRTRRAAALKAHCRPTSRGGAA